MADKERASRHRQTRRDYNRMLREFVQQMELKHLNPPVIPKELLPINEDEVIVFRATVPKNFEGVLPGGWLASILGKKARFF
jgi:hypothetical protein